MSEEHVFDELKRYVRFEAADEAALRGLAPIAAPHFARIAQEFYQRLAEHPNASSVFSGPEQVERLKATLQVWMRLLLEGPWDEAYFQQRMRIGQVHVKIGLQQRYMFGAMDLIRISLTGLARDAYHDDWDKKVATVAALDKILDIELAVMLESYANAHLDLMKRYERARGERLSSLGTMAAGLAHEIRNPLNAAHLQLTLLQRRLGRKTGPDVEGANQAANLVAEEMRRLATLVEEVLQFARPQPNRLISTDLHGELERVLGLLSEEASATGVMMTLEPGDPVHVRIDVERMRQVSLNLLRNAMEAVGRGGHVRARAGRERDEAWFEIEDNGPGLPGNDAPIFEPFFTTKEKGTGLGLAIVQRIVADHAGRVTVDSKPGCTRFTVYVPTT